MPYLLKDLVVNRVDLVDEGANSAAFIEIFKRKELIDDMKIEDVLKGLTTEHADVVKSELDRLATAAAEDLAKAKEEAAEELAKAKEEAAEELAKAKEEAAEELAKAKEEAAEELAKAKEEAAEELAKAAPMCTCDGEENEDGTCKACGRKKSADFDETETLKSLPAPARKMLEKMRLQRDAAEETVRKAQEESQTAVAVAKAASLKALPIAQDKLVEVLKTADESVVDILTTAAAAVDTAVLGEVGKGAHEVHVTASGANAAWADIEKAAKELRVEDPALSMQKAISTVIKTKPALYKAYIEGGAN